jgi:hypothetical protein
LHVFQRIIGNSSLKSLFFESILSYFDKRLRLKGFTWKLTLLPSQNKIDPNLSARLVHENPFDVVFQGGFERIEQLDFFEESLIDFRAQSPNCTIVLSTFKNSSSFLSRLYKLQDRHNFHILLNEDPGTLDRPYATNLLRQINSTHKGLRLLESLGAQKCIKLRIDQRIGRLDSLFFVNQLLDDLRPSLGGVQMRIVCSSLNTFKSLPAFMSDCLHFGHVKDLLNYWETVEKNDFETKTREMLGSLEPSAYRLRIHPEFWLTIRYLMSKGHVLPSSDLYDKLFWLEYGMVVDSVALDHLWQKQPPYFASNYKSLKWLEKNLHSGFQEMTFVDWWLRTQFGPE